MREGSYLVNTARGAVVDIDAVLAALDRGTLAGLALDVLPIEPVPADSRLVTHPRIILTPHSAFYSVERRGTAPQSRAEPGYLARDRPARVRGGAGSREPKPP